MPDVKAIEDAVKVLPPQNLAEFCCWFAEFDLARRDQKINGDLVAGTLNALPAEAKENVNIGLGAASARMASTTSSSPNLPWARRGWRAAVTPPPPPAQTSPGA